MNHARPYSYYAFDVAATVVGKKRNLTIKYFVEDGHAAVEFVIDRDTNEDLFMHTTPDEDIMLNELAQVDHEEQYVEALFARKER